MGRVQNSRHRLSASRRRKAKKLSVDDDCAGHREFVAVTIICRVKTRTIQVLVYIKTWRLTVGQSVDRITSAWAAFEWRMP